MAMDIPEDLDWVAQASLAQPVAAFDLLFGQVQQDVGQINDLKPRVWGHVRGPFCVDRVDEDRFSVRFADPVQYGPDVKMVRFRMGAEHLEIESLRERNAQIVPIIATPALDKNGRFRWMVNDKPLRSWQMRRLALEELFFARVARSDE
jgi:hypothetical protein